MGTSVSLNSVSYTIPSNSEDNWGTDVSNYLIALSTGVLSKAGGAFTLTAELDLGATFGVKSAYYKSRGVVSTAGVVRLANAESVGWRNAAGSANKELKLNSSDILEFDGAPVFTLALGTASQFLSMNSDASAYEWKSILDEDDMSSDSATDVPSQQSVKAYVDAQIATENEADEIAYSNTTSGLTATDVQAAIDEVEGRLDTAETGVSTNAASILTKQDTLTGAATTIASDNLTASRALISNASGKVGVSDVTSAELAYLDGVTSAVQTQLDTKITAASTDDLTNKTFTDAITIEEQSSTPSTPASGDKKFYAKNDGKLYTLDDAGNEIEVGSGSGGGGSINYISNPDAEAGTTNTADTTNVTISEETSEVVRGSKSFNVDVTASATTSDYAEWNISTVDYADLNSVLNVKFETRLPSGSAYTTGDLQAYIVADPSGTPVETLLGDVPSQGTFHRTYATSSETDYVLRLKVATASTAFTLVVDDFVFGPGEVTLGVPQSDWTSYTPNITDVPGTETGFWKQNGDTLHARGLAILSGAVTDVIHFDEALPSGLTLDTTKLLAEGIVGTVEAHDTGSTTRTGTLKWDGTNIVAWFDETSGQANATVPFTWASGDELYWEMTVPIAKWAGASNWLSSAGAEYASNSDTSSTASVTASGFQHGFKPQAFSANFTVGTFYTRRVRFLTPRQPTDQIILMVFDAEGNPAIAGQIDGVGGYSRIGDKEYGFYWKAVSGSDTDIDVQFPSGGRRASGATYASNGAPFSDLSATHKWLVVKLPGVIQAATPYYQRSEVISLDGDFSAGEILVARTGNQVSIHQQSSITHTSSNSGTSSAGLIPEWARPAGVAANNVFLSDSSTVRMVIVGTDGSITIRSVNWDGTSPSVTALGSGMTITYPVSD